MDILTTITVIPIYIAISGLLFIPFTVRVGAYRAKSKIFIGTGDDPELLRRMRGQANFVETVPIALLLLLSMELLGAAPTLLHILGSALVIGRIAHYLGLTQLGPALFRVIGMVATLISIVVSAGWILINVI